MPAQDSKIPKEEKVEKILPDKPTIGSVEPSSIKVELPEKESNDSKIEIPLPSIKTPQNSSKGTKELNIQDSYKSDRTKTEKTILNTSDINIGGNDDVPSGGKKKVYTLGVVITALVLGSVAGVFFFRIRQSKKNLDNSIVAAQPNMEAAQAETNLQPSPEETGSEEEQSESAGLLVTQAEQLERSEISLEILNGTDVVGLAGGTAENFEELGYEVGKIGNAEDTEGNQLYIDPELKGKLGVLMEDVEEELGISFTSGDLTDSDASARIILGE